MYITICNDSLEGDDGGGWAEMTEGESASLSLLIALIIGFIAL